MTVGWNCEMNSAEIRIPRITVGLAESRTSDSPEIRAQRGIKEFSILAQNEVNEETFGLNLNNRILQVDRRRDSNLEIPPTLLLQSATNNIGWAAFTSVAIATVGVLAAAATTQCCKRKRGLLWKNCTRETGQIMKDEPLITT